MSRSSARTAISRAPSPNVHGFEAVTLSLAQRLAKRAMDIVGAVVGLVVFSPLIALAYAIARLDTGMSGFFLQERVGRHGRLFRIIKIRTMRPTPGVSGSVTSVHDPRITRSGRLLRRFKIDELPQLLNVLLGQMSLVGPRPDVPGYADALQGPERSVLQLRPGLTGPATLCFRNEETLLAQEEHPARFNRLVLFPTKTRLNLDYLRNYSLLLDLYYIFRTFFPEREHDPNCACHELLRVYRNRYNNLA